MKSNSIIILVIALFCSVIHAQVKKRDSVFSSVRVFSLSPIHSNISKVNGLVVGVGHYENKFIDKQVVNGVNVDFLHAMPLVLVPFRIDIPINSITMGLVYKDISDFYFLHDFEQKTFLSMNGLNLSVGGFMGGAHVNGVNLSLVLMANKLNGVSVAPVLNTSKTFCGVQVSGLVNFSEEGKGVQVGVSNISERLKGVQLGVFNKTNNQRGFQFGLWNRNARRSLPFINWQFSEKKSKPKAS